jgi:hypothetical protein
MDKIRNCYACKRDSSERERGPQSRLEAKRWRSLKARLGSANRAVKRA